MYTQYFSTIKSSFSIYNPQLYRELYDLSRFLSLYLLAEVNLFKKNNLITYLYVSVIALHEDFSTKTYNLQIQINFFT